MPEFIQRMHHGRLVWVDEELKGLHRDYCLCYSCDKFFPDSVEANCKTAKAVYQLCVAEGLVLPVWECPRLSATPPLHEVNTGVEMTNVPGMIDHPVPENFTDEQMQETNQFSPCPSDNVTPDGDMEKQQVVIDLPIASPGETPKFQGYTFAQALQILLDGESVRRESWPDPKVVLKFIDEKLHIFQTGDNLFHPLTVRIGDVIGIDWLVV